MTEEQEEQLGARIECVLCVCVCVCGFYLVELGLVVSHFRTEIVHLSICRAHINQRGIDHNELYKRKSDGRN